MQGAHCGLTDVKWLKVQVIPHVGWPRTLLLSLKLQSFYYRQTFGYREGNNLRFPLFALSFSPALHLRHLFFNFSGFKIVLQALIRCCTTKTNFPINWAMHRNIVFKKPELKAVSPSAAQRLNHGKKIY